MQESNHEPNIPDQHPISEYPDQPHPNRPGSKPCVCVLLV